MIKIKFENFAYFDLIAITCMIIILVIVYYFDNKSSISADHICFTFLRDPVIAIIGQKHFS